MALYGNRLLAGASSCRLRLFSLLALAWHADGARQGWEHTLPLQPQGTGRSLALDGNPMIAAMEPQPLLLAQARAPVVDARQYAMVNAQVNTQAGAHVGMQTQTGAGVKELVYVTAGENSKELIVSSPPSGPSLASSSQGSGLFDIYNGFIDPASKGVSLASPSSQSSGAHGSLPILGQISSPADFGVGGMSSGYSASSSIGSQSGWFYSFVLQLITLFSYTGLVNLHDEKPLPEV